MDGKPTIARLIGGAGTGKTTELMRLMDGVIERGIRSPQQIGFVSFTRAARAEAARRAADKFGCRPDELEEHGWFRTLHSICYRQLGIGKELLTGSRADMKWIRDVANLAVTEMSDDSLAEYSETFAKRTDEDNALAIWSAARNRMTSLKDEWNRQIDAPTEDICRTVVERYEQAKRLDGRVDFTDILGMFAGVRFTVDGPQEVEPYCDAPSLPVWFLDEQQDSSPLLALVCLRIIRQAKWVYVAGDPFQAIYTWAGADHHKFYHKDDTEKFLGLPVAKNRILQQSHRCPADVQSLGEKMLEPCSDYFDRGIKAAKHDGEVEQRKFSPTALMDISAEDNWLLLARSNHHARRIAKILDRNGVPWVPTKGNGGWHAPSQNVACAALLKLQQGEGRIDGDEWTEVLKCIPSKYGEKELLIHGAKAEWSRVESPKGEYPAMSVTALSEVGATSDLRYAILTGEWREFTRGAYRFCEGVEKWGLDAVMNPQIRVGTIHSVKGAEADNVLLLTTIGRNIRRAMETQDGEDEERRVWYVGITRARKRLVVAKENTKWRMAV